jgi:predicted transcriptional regulator
MFEEKTLNKMKHIGIDGYSKLLEGFRKALKEVTTINHKQITILALIYSNGGEYNKTRLRYITPCNVAFYRHYLTNLINEGYITQTDKVYITEKGVNLIEKYCI